MNIRTTFSKWFLPLAVFCSFAVMQIQLQAQATDLAIAPPAVEMADQQVLKVYYFHGNVRCTSCELIEKYTTQAINTGFADQIAQGDVELTTVNLEARGNSHFIEDFQLITRSVVIAIEEHGETMQYRRLDRVWELVTDKQDFQNYLYQQIGELTDTRQTSRDNTNGSLPHG
ncbi:nitrophenyl compound nitroreductase subunit ArsF family protein [Shewanella sp. TC10]|uniref:nitrophenyl compound nitroreductase subunit ArsF family protein n=1 Tax=Shewanella sp. TC10 TaxID=1419739 RepID=UPI00129D90F3|nr:nitrophenyl compound nitroreductase subunit ArsF family protein [Shewanella sp. TC10]